MLPDVDRKVKIIKDIFLPCLPFWVYVAGGAVLFYAPQLAHYLCSISGFNSFENNKFIYHAEPSFLTKRIQESSDG